MKKITRIWHGITKAEHAEDYLKYVEDTGIKNYKMVKGNISAKLLRRIEGDICHFLTVPEWDSYDTIKNLPDMISRRRNITRPTKNIF